MKLLLKIPDFELHLGHIIFFSFIFFITVASYTGTKLDNILDAQVVFKSFVTTLSLIAIGIPNNILSTSLFSNSFATFIASSLFNVINALYAKDVSRKISSAFRTRQLNGDYIGG